METTGLHRDLELRLEALAERIAALRRKLRRAKGREKVEEFGEIAELEDRYATLAERLQALDREGPGFRQDAKAELEKVADDLSGTVEDFMSWIDADHQGNPPPLRGRKP
jgi:predicted  nucleic acid-binding Zn-ribbon protein